MLNVPVDVSGIEEVGSNPAGAMVKVLGLKFYSLCRRNSLVCTEPQ
jgi:hypothetical protein